MALVLDGTTGIVSANIADGTISASDLASGAITSTALPAGSVLQVVSYTFPLTSVTVSSTVFVSMSHSVSITAKQNNSKFLVTLNGGGWYDNGNGSQAFYATFKRELNGSGTYNYVDNGYGNNYGLCRMSGDGNSWNIKPFAAEVLDSPGQSAGTIIKYEVFGRQSGASSMYSHGDRGQPTLTVMEIAA